MTEKTRCPAGWARSWHDDGNGLYIKLSAKNHSICIIVAKAKNHPTFDSDNYRVLPKMNPKHTTPSDVDPESIIITIGQNRRTVWNLEEFKAIQQAVQYGIESLEDD